MALAFALLAVTVNRQAPVIMVAALALDGDGAAAFFPANLAALLAAAGSNACFRRFSATRTNR